MIAVFDSGVGGLPFANAIEKLLPEAPLFYFGDTAYMPYGSRTTAEIFERMRWFIQNYDSEVDIFVIACNSATVSVIDDYRHMSTKPFVGVEPGIKPAANASHSHSVAVLATERTVNSPQLTSLIQRFGADTQFHLIACPGLADAIEYGKTEQTNELLNNYLAQVPQSVDTIVLACTHYILAKEYILARLPHVQIIDVADAVARRTAELYRNLPMRLPGSGVRIACSGDRAQFEQRVATLAPDLYKKVTAL